MREFEELSNFKLEIKVNDIPVIISNALLEFKETGYDASFQMFKEIFVDLRKKVIYSQYSSAKVFEQRYFNERSIENRWRDIKKMNSLFLFIWYKPDKWCCGGYVSRRIVDEMFGFKYVLYLDSAGLVQELRNKELYKKINKIIFLFVRSLFRKKIIKNIIVRIWDKNEALTHIFIEKLNFALIKRIEDFYGHERTALVLGKKATEEVFEHIIKYFEKREIEH